jgi:hypothetical protein
MTQHETNALAGLSPARALADGQILTCMPADDSKNEKNCLSSFSVGAQSQGNKTSNISSQQRQDAIRQSFLQVIASQATEQVVKELTRILLNDFDRRYHPTTNGQ